MPPGPDDDRDDDLPPGDPARSGSVDISIGDDEPTTERAPADEEVTAEAIAWNTAADDGWPQIVDDDVSRDDDRRHATGADVPIATAAPTQSESPAYSGPERRSSPEIGPPGGRERRRSMQGAVERVEDVVSGGVGKVGAGIGKIGGGMSRLGDRVDRLPGVRTTKLGHGISELGEGLSELGDSLTQLPKVTRTKRGRILVRSLFVGFILVFGWIAVIVYFQLRGGERPDLRPRAEQIMVALRDGEYRKLFDDASPRFQEITDYDRFERDMKDMNATLGRFREIASVNETLVTRGPGGLIARVELQLDFDPGGRARGSISLHWDEGRWKLLGVGVDVPDAIYATATSKPARDERSKAPEAVRAAAERLLELAYDGRADAIWDDAAPLFKDTVSKADFVQIELDRTRILGRYKRVLSETKATQTPGGSSAWLTALVEYDNANVPVTFGFALVGDAWKVTSYRVVLPMPRAPRAPGEGSSTGSDQSPDSLRSP